MDRKWLQQQCAGNGAVLLLISESDVTARQQVEEGMPNAFGHLSFLNWYRSRL